METDSMDDSRKRESFLRVTYLIYYRKGGKKKKKKKREERRRKISKRGINLMHEGWTYKDRYAESREGSFDR